MRRRAAAQPSRTAPVSYRRHLICPDLLGRHFFVQVDGFTIASCLSLAEAMAAVDGLLDGPEVRG